MTESMQRPQVRLPKVAASYAVLVAVAFLINSVFGRRPLLAIATDGHPLVEQIAWGGTLALLIGIPVWSATVLIPAFASLRSQLVELISRIDTSGLNVVWIAMLAGVSEETLFRGALQPVVGLWWTSVIFVLLHSGTYQFRTMNWQKGVFAVLIFLASLLLGRIFTTLGLIAAIVVHTIWDLLGLVVIQRLARGNAVSA